MTATSTHPSTAYRWETIATAVILIAVGCRVELAGGIRLGDITALVLLPLTWPQVRQSKEFSVLTFTTVLALLAGTLLVLNLADSPLYSAQMRESFLALLAAGVGIPAAALWARRILTTPAVVAFLGTGLLLNGILGMADSSNPWKFSLGIPSTLIVLALVMRRSRWVQLGAAVAMSITFMLNDSRSSFGMALATGVILSLFDTGSPRSKQLTRTGTPWLQLVSVVLVAWGAYNLVLVASDAGLLGEAAQLRTQSQFGQSGGLLAARPEAIATLALMKLNPWGFGPGVGLNYAELTTAKTALAASGYDVANNGYVASFMFGHAVELHSVIGDLWAAFGPLGVLFVLVVVILSVRALAALWNVGRLSAIAIFLLLMFLWNAPFGPFSPMVVMTGMLLFLSVQKPTES